MKSKSLAPVGSLHPFLFLAGIYVIALFLSVFICSSLFYSCNASSASSVSAEKRAPAVPEAGQHTVALR
jgi:hypothetical protein